MLLALTEDNGIAGKALAESGASLDKLRQVVVEATPQAAKAASPAKELELDDATKKLVENAVRMAINGEDQHIGTQHLLLALIALQDPRTQAILESAGLDPEAIRQKLSRENQL
jgi:ATP-dependent Clp protease ATP-binding subunit ClpC